MSKAIIFVRVSSEQQSTDSQKEALMHYAKAHGFSSKDIIPIDKTESGYRLDESEREGLTELYQAMENPDVSDVFIWELSRLSRRPKDLYSIREKFLEKQIQLHCKEPSFTLLNKDRSGYDANANILFSLFGAMAEQEIIEKVARFSRGKQRLAEQGKYNGGAIPYGYKVNKDKDNIIEEDEVEGAIVRQIFNLYEQGMSQPAIAKELYHQGVKGRAVKGTKAITISLVHQVLTNKLLTGAPLNKRSKASSQEYERIYPQIITPEQFERCRQIAANNNKTLPKTTYIHYAQGLIRCPVCNGKYVSTGNKGYYRCRDAYNYNKTYEGYSGDMCQNKTCISCNIMDSLLWELTKDYESSFIMNDASNKIAECNEQKSILQKKIDAIPLLLEENEGKRQRALTAYVEKGWKEALFNATMSELDEKKRKIEASRAEYLEGIAHYDALIDDLNQRMKQNYDVQTDEGIDNFIGYADAVWKRVCDITDDKERSILIHKHIEKVTISATTFNYKFSNHPEGKDAFAKEIIVYPYLSKPRTFIFIPYNGKGGVMLQKNPSGGEHVSLANGLINVDIPEYQPFPMEYLARSYDKSKYERRKKGKEEKMKKEATVIEGLKKKGYIPIYVAVAVSKKSYSTIYKAIKNGKLDGKKECGIWFITRDSLNSYLASKRVLNAAPQNRITPEQALLDSIFSREEQKRLFQSKDKE